MNDLDYALRYAVLELKKDEEVYAYIVSKCYLVDRNRQGYRVFFPYKDIDKYLAAVNTGDGLDRLWDKQVDIHKLDTVREVFDNYDDANIICYALNRRYRHQVLSNLEWGLSDYRKKLYDMDRLLSSRISNAKRMESYINYHVGDVVSKNNKVTEDNGRLTDYIKKLKR